MEAVSASETSAYFYETTRRHMSEGCRLRPHRAENLKYHTIFYSSVVYLTTLANTRIELSALIVT
jgi:hypothetical protein